MKSKCVRSLLQLAVVLSLLLAPMIGTVVGKSATRSCNRSRTICKTTYILRIANQSGTHSCRVSGVVYGMYRVGDSASVRCR